MDMPLISRQSVIVNMLPVCECGKVIPDLVLDVDINKAGSGDLYQQFHFEPSCCPNCGKYIECLQVYGRYVDMFKRKCK